MLLSITSPGETSVLSEALDFQRSIVDMFFVDVADGCSLNKKSGTHSTAFCVASYTERVRNRVTPLVVHGLSYQCLIFHAPICSLPLAPHYCNSIGQPCFCIGYF
jgi:hypothetical protein